MTKQTEKNPIKKLKKQVVCPVEFALRILGGKWRGSILYQLKDEALRFNELKKRVQNAAVDFEDVDNYLTNKVLSGHLKALIDYQLIHKMESDTSYATYQLTSIGHSIIPTLLYLFDWGEKVMRLPIGNQG
jgi:DNA-binding HxlR family transcriptional regulator